MNFASTICGVIVATYSLAPNPRVGEGVEE
jgi:hypothetical protein